MSHYVVISSDCHAAPKKRDFRPYVGPGQRDAFDAWIAESERLEAEAQRKRIGGKLFDEDYVKEAEKAEPVATGGMTGAWDHDRRVRELEADGVVGASAVRHRRGRRRPACDPLAPRLSDGFVGLGAVVGYPGGDLPPGRF